MFVMENRMDQWDNRYNVQMEGDLGTIARQVFC